MYPIARVRGGVRFDSAMAGGHVAGSDSAFAGKACDASFTLPLRLFVGAEGAKA